MIVSCSYKTDIPAFFGQWFIERLEAGKVMALNPYSKQPFEVSLAREDVSAFVFWTRNLGPFFPVLERLEREGYPFYVHYTLTGYPRLLEPYVVPTAEAIEQMRRLSGRFGPERLVWRYDPVVVSDLTPPGVHLDRFQGLSESLRGLTHEVVFSFLQPYLKSKRRLAVLRADHGVETQNPPDDEKRLLLSALAEIALQSELEPKLCSQPQLLDHPLEAARCIDVLRIEKIAGHPIPARKGSNRKGCGCAIARDIGAYHTCMHGCIYCYATQNQATAKKNASLVQPNAFSLVQLPPLSLQQGSLFTTTSNAPLCRDSSDS